MLITRNVIEATIAQAPASDRAAWHETHISWVLLLGDHAYKIKKPIKLDFLDARCQEERRRLCYQESYLNQRLAPDVYEGVVPVFLTEGSLGFGEGSQCVDYAVRMRRLDPTRHAPTVLATAVTEDDTWYSLGTHIAAFQQKLAPVNLHTPLHALHQNWKWTSLRSALIQALGTSIWQQIDTLEAWADSLWEEVAQQAKLRARQGMIRDGHGDLHLGNIFLYDPPIFFDCLEFDTALREIDVWDELAFLIMDMESQGNKAQAAEVVRGYAAHPGSTTPQGALFTYYKLYRAGIRAKVHFLAAQRASTTEQMGQELTTTLRYLDLMDHYRLEGDSTLIEAGPLCQ